MFLLLNGNVIFVIGHLFDGVIGLFIGRREDNIFHDVDFLFGFHVSGHASGMSRQFGLTGVLIEEYGLGDKEKTKDGKTVKDWDEILKLLLKSPPSHPNEKDSSDEGE